jgi:ribosome-associated protein
MTLTKLVKTIIAALEEIKARDIEILDVSKMTDLCDRMIIASGDSSRQTKAIANNVSEKVKAGGGTVYGIEGEQVGEWVLVDLGDVLVHVMQSAVRSHYNLEELWAQARKISRTAAAGASTSRKRVGPANREGSAEEEEMPAPASPSDTGKKKRPRSAPGDSE